MQTWNSINQSMYTGNRIVHVAPFQDQNVYKPIKCNNWSLLGLQNEPYWGKIHWELAEISHQSRPSHSERGLVAKNGWLMWLVYHDIRNAWANLHDTFRGSWGRVGDCPRPRKKLVQSLLIFFFFFLNQFYLSTCNLTLSDARQPAQLWGLTFCDISS